MAADRAVGATHTVVHRDRVVVVVAHTAVARMVAAVADWDCHTWETTFLALGSTILYTLYCNTDVSFVFWG